MCHNSSFLLLGSRKVYLWLLQRFLMVNHRINILGKVVIDLKHLCFETQKKPMKLCVDFRRWQLDAKHSCRAGGITGILPQSLQICAVQILGPYTLLPFTDERFFPCLSDILMWDFIECLFYETLNAFLAFRQFHVFVSSFSHPRTRDLSILDDFCRITCSWGMC